MIRERKASGTTTSPAPDLPEGYPEFIISLKQRIRSAQVKAAPLVNRKLVLLYWQIGNDILTRQEREGWGAKVIDRLSSDLVHEFPDMRGFTVRNLKYMRKFAETWCDLQFVQQVAAHIPWFHHCVILDKVPDLPERERYIRETQRLYTQTITSATAFRTFAWEACSPEQVSCFPGSHPEVFNLAGRGCNVRKH